MKETKCECCHQCANCGQDICPYASDLSIHRQAHSATDSIELRDNRGSLIDCYCEDCYDDAEACEIAKADVIANWRTELES